MRLVEIEENSDLLEKYKDEVNFALDKYNQGIVIYRGSKTYTKNIMFIDPTTRTNTRKSANTFNYYTLWMSNNPQWASYPKRDRSLICSTSIGKAKIYGRIMIVIPLVDCKIGVCPNDDIWDSYKPNYSDFTYWLYKHFIKRWPDIHNTDLTYQVFIQKLKEITPTNDDSYFEPNFDELLEKHGSAEGVVSEVLDPVKNGFILTSWKQFNILVNREIWLSAPCLLIKPFVFRKLARDRKNAIS